MKSRLLKIERWLGKRDDAIVTIQRSYATAAPPSPPPSPEEEAEIDRLVEQAKRENPRARHFVIRKVDGKITVTPVGGH
jgi:hypothetical protein